MKCRVKTDWRTGGRAIIVESDKGAQYVYADAQFVRSGTVAEFIPFQDVTGGKTYSFTFDSSGLILLDDLLAQPLHPGQLGVLLVSLLDIIYACEGNGLSRLRVLLDPDMVFVCPLTGQLRVAYIPLQGIDAPGSEGELLRYICDSGDFPRDDIVLARNAADFARRGTVFTGKSYERFLQNMGLRTDKHHRPPASPTRAKRTYETTDSLGSRTSHGYDFVSALSRQAESASEPADFATPDDPGTGSLLPASDGPTDMLDQADDPASPNGPVGPQTVFRLVEHDGSASWDLTPGTYLLGRSDKCNLIIPCNKQLSRLHARLQVEQDGCSIEDLASKNGTYVNGNRLAPNRETPLKAGDVISAGSSNLRLFD